MALYTYRARLTATVKYPIYDADTVRLLADLGFGLTSDLGPCRLYGINAPEMRGSDRPKDTLARDWLRELLELDDEFTIRTFKHDKGKYGRYLCVIKLDDGTNVNEALITAGNAIERQY